MALTFRDREVADPDRPLAGSTWTVGTTIEGQSTGSVVATLEAPTMVLGRDETFHVISSRNNGIGTNVATTA